ncbi:type II secretion system protein M [Pseudomonas syringae]|nr:type II secretion system protein M [Pseudomonas syringae]MCF5069873.1 type II secretion system protein M [Pseudomonas syringae]
MKNRWQHLTHRERQLILILVAGVVPLLIFALLWQPAWQRHETAERKYQQQRALAAQMRQAQPQSGRKVDTARPLSLRISDSLAVAGLDVEQMDSDSEQIRLTVSGSVGPLLQWLDGLERDGVSLQSLTLQPADKRLEARLVLKE